MPSSTVTGHWTCQLQPTGSKDRHKHSSAPVDPASSFTNDDSNLDNQYGAAHEGSWCWMILCLLKTSNSPPRWSCSLQMTASYYIRPTPLALFSVENFSSAKRKQSTPHFENSTGVFCQTKPKTPNQKTTNQFAKGWKWRKGLIIKEWHEGASWVIRLVYVAMC